MQFRILGPLEAERGGRPVPLGGKQQRRLLALLLLHANESVAADRLVDELWGDPPPARAVKRLQLAITRLRQVLDVDSADGERVLRTTAGGYLVAVGPGELDARVFEARLDEGRRALGEEQPARAVAILGEALALWRGRALAEVAYEPFAQLEIRRLEELRLAAREARIEADLRLGRHAALVAELEALVSEHPTRERLAAHLMVALYRCGRQADALDVYKRTHAFLTTELGLVPGSALQALQARILEQSPALELSAAGESRIPPQPVLRAHAGFVGRVGELAVLRRAWQRVAGGERQLMLVTGEPGVGKTSLAVHFARQVYGDAAAVLYGRCEEEAVIPYQPWVEALHHYVVHADADELRRRVGADAPELARLLPGLEARIGPLVRPSFDEPDTQRFRLFEGVSTLLRSLAADRPLVLILEDLHWADRSTLLLLRHVVRATTAASVLLIVSYRDVDARRADSLSRTVTELRRDCELELIALKGLQYDDVTILARRRRPGAGDQFIRRLFEETAGNAFFIEEVLRNTPDHRGEEPQPPLPDGVRQAIASRLGHLSGAARHALTMASVIGQRFELSVLERAGDDDRDRLLDALDEAVEGGIVRESPGAAARWSFVHALTRDAIYDDLTLTRRARLHLRVAEALERSRAPTDSARIGEIAHHYCAAAAVGGARRAVTFCVLASEHAASQLAYEEAVHQLRRGLEALKHGDAHTVESEMDLNLRLGKAEQQAGEMSRARDAYAAAAHQAQQLGDADALARAALGFAGPTWHSYGEVDDDAIALLERALAVLPDSEGALRARILARLAIALYFTDAGDRPRALTHEAVATAQSVGDAETVRETLEARLWACWTPDRVHEQLARASELLELGREASGDETQALARRWRIAALLELGRIDDGWIEIAEHARVAERLGQTYERMYVTAYATTEALYHARWEQAEQGLAAIAAVDQRRAGADALQIAGIYVVTLALERGGLAALEPAVQSFAEKYPNIPAWGYALPLIQAEAGRHADARALLDRLCADRVAGLPRDNNWMTGLALLALACERLGETGHESTLYELLVPFAERVVVLGAGAAVWGPVTFYLGVLAALRGRTEQALNHLDAALAFSERTGGVTWAARTRRAREKLQEDP